MALWLVVLEALLGIVALGLAALIIGAGGRRPENRSLAVLLAVDGVGWFGLAAAAASGGLLLGGWSAVVARATLAASPWLYAWFVVRTLDVPLTRPFSTPAARRTFIALAIVVPVLLVTVLDSVPAYVAVRDYVGVTSGPNLIVATWALFAAIQEFRQAADRRQAAAYVAAFATRDLALMGLFGAVLVLKQAPGLPILAPTVAAVKVTLLVHLAYLVYGILSGQVLGLDDKVRLAIQKAVVLTAVAGIFLVLTEGTEMLVGAESPVMAIVAAGIITVVFQPVQRGATRLAEKVLPGSVPSGRLPRKVRHAMYRKQAGIAWRDGEVRRKEREMLEELRQELDLDADEAARLEAEAKGRAMP